MKTRQLINNRTGKLIYLTVSGNFLIASTGTKDKLRTSEKEFENYDEACKAFIKRELEAIKKGYN